MDKQRAAKGKKLVIDIVLGLLYVLLLGYAFTGGLFHEIAGVAFAVTAVIHNGVNMGWYKALRQGTYSRKRTLVTAVNIALLVDAAAVVVTGVLQSKYLFRTGIPVAWMRDLHSTLALIGLVLIAAHVLVHAFSHTKKRHGKLPVLLVVLVVVAAAVLKLWALPYWQRHFVTVEIHRETAISGEQVELGGGRTLTVYFTRVGNTDFDEDINAVSGASLLLDQEGELLGNSQVIALMIQDGAGGDLVSIDTEQKYPSSYSDTVAVAGQELKRQDLPGLVNMPETLDGYDRIILVYPLWWYTIPKPVEAFLTGYDLSGKTVIPVVTHGGSGVGTSVEDIKKICNGTVVDHPLEIYCGDVPHCRTQVTQWLQEISAATQ